MIVTNAPEFLSTYALQNIPLVECRPHFEAALARINERKVESSSEKQIEIVASDSFGGWFESD